MPIPQQLSHPAIHGVSDGDSFDPLAVDKDGVLASLMPRLPLRTQQLVGERVYHACNPGKSMVDAAGNLQAPSRLDDDLERECECDCRFYRHWHILCMHIWWQHIQIPTITKLLLDQWAGLYKDTDGLSLPEPRRLQSMEDILEVIRDFRRRWLIEEGRSEEERDEFWRNTEDSIQDPLHAIADRTSGD